MKILTVVIAFILLFESCGRAKQNRFDIQVICGKDTLLIEKGNIDVSKVRSSSGHHDLESGLMTIIINPKKEPIVLSTEPFYLIDSILNKNK